MFVCSIEIMRGRPGRRLASLMSANNKFCLTYCVHTKQMRENKLLLQSTFYNILFVIQRFN